MIYWIPVSFTLSELVTKPDIPPSQPFNCYYFLVVSSSTSPRPSIAPNISPSVMSYKGMG